MPDRATAIADLISNYLVLNKGAEIGVWKGETSEYWLRRFPDLKMILVDPYLAYPQSVYKAKINTFEKQADFDRLHTQVRTRFCWRYPGRIQIIRKPSSEAAAEVEPRSLDFVFIDGNHGAKYVRQDILLWREKVRTGGVLCGHDARRRLVRRAVLRTIGKAEMVGENCWFKMVLRDGV